MIIILSHGEQDEMLYAYDERYHLSSTIINPIVTKNTTLADKPKFFIIQVKKIFALMRSDLFNSNLKD